MAKIYKQITDLIGKTPLVELGKYSASKGLETPVIAKVEFFNPGGSVKDRIALAMIEDAEQKGILKPGATIIEPTSGNTGVGLALVSAVKGYHLILTMPETMSVERRNLVKAYGAEVRLTSGKDGMPGAIKAAEELRDSIPGSVILGQFTNPANPAKHYATTGPEIWADTDGEIDIFVAGVGTGGTISGIAKYLKEQNPNVKVIAVEPATSPVLNGGQSGPHKIQGIGAGFIPETYSSEYIDEVLDIQNDDAILVWDKDQNGTISSSDETNFLGLSKTAKNDLDVLREVFDTNKDGIFDKNDDEWNNFALWQDKNMDGLVDEDEFTKIANSNILKLNLNLFAKTV
jgi:cysteine synthase A